MQRVLRQQGLAQDKMQEQENALMLNEEEIKQQLAKQSFRLDTSSSDEEIDDLLNYKKDWNQLSFMTKMKLFNFYIIISILANIFQITGSLISVLNIFVINETQSIMNFKIPMIGLGAMFAVLMLLNYIKDNYNMNLMNRTIYNSKSDIFYFVVGSLPVFFGFIFLSLKIFQNYVNFSDTTTSVITLFAFSMGDTVNEFMLNVWNTGMLGRIYYIFYGLCFYTLLSNVFVALVMEGYEISKKKKEKQMNSIKKKQKEDEQQLFKEKIFKIINQSQEQVDTSSMDDKQLLLQKLHVNTQRMDYILDDLQNLLTDIQKSVLQKQDQRFLYKVFKENIQNLTMSLKFSLQKNKRQ